MPLMIISGEAATQNVKTNPGSTWPVRGETGSRLEPLARPRFEPGFRLVAGEKIFTIGSCFARNIEVLLQQSGFVIPAREIIRADPEFELIGHNILNNYGAPSILNEIRWALDLACPFTEDQAFFEIYPGKWVDAHLSHALKPAPIEVVRARRRAIASAYRTIPECRVIIITLGLAECWLDRATGTYINTAPRRSTLRDHPGRFELHVLSYDEVLGSINAALTLIRRHGHPEVRVILTVSPVPLTSTYRDEDVMVANAYSKAVLRAATEAVVHAHDFVDYFPSYESVTLSERGAALLDDQVHPTPAAIQLNTSRMIHAYVGAGAVAIDQIRATIAENPMAALPLLTDRPDLVCGDPELAQALFLAVNRSGRMDLLEAALPHLGDLVPEEERNLARARLALSRGDSAGALALLTVEPALRAVRGTYWMTRLDAHIAGGDMVAARSAARAWAEFNIRTPEPFRRLAVAHCAMGQYAEAETMFEAALALADDEPRTLLDYAEMLMAMDRATEARAIADTIRPANPSQSERLARVKLWSHEPASGAARATDAVPDDTAIVAAAPLFAANTNVDAVRKAAPVDNGAPRRRKRSR
jgi:tetratricopeptide (TPR) repeat protein